MQIALETLAQNYRHRKNAELLVFHASGTLAEMAYEVPGKELILSFLCGAADGIIIGKAGVTLLAS
ncbi:MAG: hypothetical protein ACU4EQ_08335 [Candidatus Nitrosoglobus sp.]